MPARFSIRAAIQPSKSTSRSTATASDGRPCRQGRRQASVKRSSWATAIRPDTAAKASGRLWATRTARSAILQGRGQSTGVGDEGGFAPNLKSNREAVEVVLEAIGKTGLRAGTDVSIALDVAASELWRDGTYTFTKSGEPDRSSDQMI